MDTRNEVAVYVKLPKGFIAETKGSMDSMELRDIEKAKIHCAKEHFKAISSENVVYDVVNSYQALLEKVMK